MFFYCTFYGQNSSQNLPDYQHLKFDKSDGYYIDEVNSIQFDEDGWVWMSGIKYESQNYELGTQIPIILKFDGKNFYEIPLPNDISKNLNDLNLLKADKNSFFLKVHQNNSSSLLKLNTKTFDFENITLPNTNKFEIKKLNDKILLIQQDNGGNLLYYFNEDSSLDLIGKMETDKSPEGFRLFDLGNHFILDKYTIKPEVFPKGNEHEDLNINSILNPNSIINSFFTHKSEVYFDYLDNPTIYHYNKEKQSSEKTNLFTEDINNQKIASRLILNDTKGNILVKIQDGNNTSLKIYKDIEEEPIWTYAAEQKTSKETKFASRDFTKELVVDNKTDLDLFLFNKGEVISFLNDKSIRSIVDVSNGKILITTDYNGWYLLDLNNNKVKPFWFYVNGKKIIPKFNRNAKFINDTIWANNGKNLLCVPINNPNAINFPLKYNVSAMTQVDQTIYFADEENTVRTFDKKKKEYKILIKKDAAPYENILLFDNVIVGATHKGLRIIDNEKISLIKMNDDEKDNYLISLYKWSKNKVLVGTKSGKLYSFDIRDKRIELLYEDELSASIATILVDDKERIWLNTFAGIVVLDGTRDSVIRFGKNDGLSHFEANRFSALKLENGNFLVGTIRGVNYFHPDSLISQQNKNLSNYQLQLLSLKKYDSDKNATRTIFNREYLDSLETIVLPAKSRNLVLNFSMKQPQLDVNYNYRYRLKESDWINIEKTHEIRLLNLEAGNYSLEIQAIDKSKSQVLSTIAFELNVQQFFYESLWFYSSIFIIISLIILIYTIKWKQVNKANYRNKLLKTEIEYKKKDLADFATNISRNQQWNDHLIEKMVEIREFKGRKKGAALVNLEKEIRDKNSVEENNFEFQKRIDVISNEFYNSLLQRFPKLSKTEIKLCSLIRLDLDAQDIATLQNVDINSVYKSRYRLRKKLDIDSDVDLDVFLKSL